MITFPGHTLVVGTTGPAVATLQHRLIALGHPVGRYGPDGIYGPDTHAAVQAFQHARGIVPDGIVGPLTWGVVFAGGAPPGRRPDVTAQPVPPPPPEAMGPLTWARVFTAGRPPGRR